MRTRLSPFPLVRGDLCLRQQALSWHVVCKPCCWLSSCGRSWAKNRQQGLHETYVGPMAHLDSSLGPGYQCPEGPRTGPGSRSQAATSPAVSQRDTSRSGKWHGLVQYLQITIGRSDRNMHEYNTDCSCHQNREWKDRRYLRDNYQ